MWYQIWSMLVLIMRRYIILTPIMIKCMERRKWALHYFVSHFDAHKTIVAYAG